MNALIHQDPLYLEKRHRQYQHDMEYFAGWLVKIVNVMPPPLRLYHYDTDEWEVTNDPLWQRRIDNILQKRDEFVEKYYPEFYQPKI